MEAFFSILCAMVVATGAAYCRNHNGNFPTSFLLFLSLTDGLISSQCERNAKEFFLRGLERGLWPPEWLIDHLVEGMCAAGEPGSAREIMSALMQQDWQPSTFHHNCLLMAMVRTGVNPS